MENTHTVYFNMCHHYRKIFSAKPRVDTSLPRTLQMKETNDKYKLHREESFIRSKTSSQENLKQRIEMKNTVTRQNNAPVICPYYYQRHFKKEFENADTSLGTTISKNGSAQSTVRASRILCPPRKKRVQLAVSGKIADSRQKEKEIRGKQNVKKITINEDHVKPSKKISILSVNSYSEESSEDSAYNEGECNTDSRGSTPQNAINKHESTKQRSIMNSKSILQNLPQPSRSRVEDAVCIQFLTDITNDILRKNIYTNTALRGVLQQHVELNKYDLEMETMLAEITKLQERLGIPKDEKLDDEDFGLGGLNLDDDVKSLEDMGSTTSTATGTLLLPTTTVTMLPKCENDLIDMDEAVVSPTQPLSNEHDLIAAGTHSPTDAGVDEDREQNVNYSDNFSENSYSAESSRSEGEKSADRESSVVINDEASSEIEEDVPETDDNKSEKYSDVDENISHSKSDSEISEIC